MRMSVWGASGDSATGDRFHSGCLLGKQEFATAADILIKLRDVGGISPVGCGKTGQAGGQRCGFTRQNAGGRLGFDSMARPTPARPGVCPPCALCAGGAGWKTCHDRYSE
jgi:hypothetical protein